MGAFIPLVHTVKQCITLMHHQHRAFGALLQPGAGHYHGDFNDALGLGVEPGHFAIQPDQILI